MRILNLTIAAAMGLLPAAAQTLQPAPVTPATEATDLLEPSAFATESPVASAFRAPGGPVRSDALTIHPGFSALISGLNFSYESALGQGLWSYEIQAYLGYNERVWNNPTLVLGTGFGVRRYLLERGAGTYVAPSLDLVNVHRFEKGEQAGNNVAFVVPNLRMGYRWTWNVFTTDVSAGLAYYEANPTQGVLSGDDPDRRGLIPMVQWALGVPF